MADEPSNEAIIRQEVEHIGGIYGLYSPDDAFSLGGDLFAGLTVENGRVRGAREAMSILKRSKPHLFKDARSMSASDRASELRRISQGHELGLDKTHHDRMIGRMKAEQARYLTKRSQNQ
jgi:hypothetical protein